MASELFSFDVRQTRGSVLARAGGQLRPGRGEEFLRDAVDESDGYSQLMIECVVIQRALLRGHERACLRDDLGEVHLVTIGW